MKTILKPKKTNLVIGMAFLMLIPIFSRGQNLISNSDFNSGTTPWNVNGMLVEINTEKTYGGVSKTNQTAEIDNSAGLRQKIGIAVGKVYQLTFKASRRRSGGTPANPGITVDVIGDVTGTSYLNNNKIYTNTTFAFTDEVLTFTIPSSSTDNIIVVQFTSYNNSTTLGVIVDDVTLTVASSLPVQLISFTGELSNGQSTLNWKTASELNNKYFIVERSVNGTRYDSIGLVRAAVTNNSTKSYTFTDMKINAGTNFYRLRQVDIDGSISYSKVVTVKLQQANTGVKIFPTVTNTNVNFQISASEAGAVSVIVYDLTGKVRICINKSVSAGANQQSIEVNSLHEGIYYLHIQNNNSTISYTQTFQKVS